MLYFKAQSLEFTNSRNAEVFEPDVVLFLGVADQFLERANFDVGIVFFRVAKIASRISRGRKDIRVLNLLLQSR